MELYQRIAAEAEHGKPVFPTHVEIGLRIKRALDDPNCSINSVATLIQAEPLLSARAVAMANSVVYNRSGREVTDVRQAVSRLGFRTLRTLTMALVVKQISCQPTDPALQTKAQQLWKHTAHVAALCQVIARRVTFQDPDTAMFVGILHEVSGFYLLARAKEYPELVGENLDSWQGSGEALVGASLLKVLEVPEMVSAAIIEYWQGYLAIPPASLGDTLLLAESLAPVASSLYWSPEEDMAVQAGKPLLDFQLDEETLGDILSESAEDVQSLIGALQ